ncbi:hypothetical protein U9M48_044330 [Paspalum notatum var. saurae]|uniref:Probable zinc-ribbon domain-containing protein n=1 Tax=Paspalum notatum var. saurae TaxID=547442 RepID=A0AAQ3UZ23_PASNO
MAESEEIRMRFGRCPYCRTMIFQSPEAVIFFCSKCRTPIRGAAAAYCNPSSIGLFFSSFRALDVLFLASCFSASAGKNPVPTEGIDHALSRLEILSVDTESVFSNEPDDCHNKLAPSPGVDIDADQPPFFQQDVAPAPSSSTPAPPGGFGSARRRRGHSLNNGAFRGVRCDDGFVDSNDQEKLRPLSRRMRRPSSSDSSVLRYGVLMPTDSETDQGLCSPRNAYERLRRRRRSLRGSQEFDTSAGMLSRQGTAPSPSPLGDPAFNMELLHALDSLRGLIAAIEPASRSGGGSAGARRDAHAFRRLESRLAREFGHRRTSASSGTDSSSPSSSCGGHSRGERRKSHCRPVLGGAPFLVCGGCSELLQAPATTALSCGKVARLRCGGCQEVLLRLTVPAGARGSAPHKTARAVSPPPRPEHPASCNSSACGDSAQPLHRALGYSSPSPLLQSRRY